MAPTDLHDLSHRWRPALRPDTGTPSRYDCPDCLLSSNSPYDALCPDRVAEALTAAEAAGYARCQADMVALLGTSRIWFDMWMERPLPERVKTHNAYTMGWEDAVCDCQRPTSMRPPEPYRDHYIAGYLDGLSDRSRAWSTAKTRDAHVGAAGGNDGNP